MSNRPLFFTVIAIFLSAAGAFAASKAPPKAHQLRWIVAHNPTNTEINQLLEQFASRIQKNTDGRVEVKIDFLGNEDKDRHHVGLSRVEEGQAEMSQVNVGVLYNYVDELQVLGLPYFFRNHQQVRNVIVGDLGAELLQKVNVGSKNKLHGLAFTYSGGMRVFYGGKKVQSLADLKKLTIPSPQEAGPSRDFFDLLHAKYVPYPESRKQSVELHLNKAVDFEENELNRLAVLANDYPELLKKVKFVTETNHTVYLTAIIINAKFLESLGSELGDKVKAEVQWLADKERSLSIAQAEVSKAQLQKKGVSFVKLQPKAEALLVSNARKIKEKFRVKHPEVLAKAEAALNAPVPLKAALDESPGEAGPPGL